MLPDASSALPDRHVPLQAGPRSNYAAAAASLSTLMGIAVLAGWAFDVPAMRSVIPGAVEMKANTAVGLIGTSAALMMAAWSLRSALFGAT